MLSFLLQLGISSHYFCLKTDKWSLSLLQQAKAPAFFMSCHACIFWTMCSLHSLPAGSVCFGLLLCSVFSCLQSMILLAGPSHHWFYSVAAYQRAGKNGYAPHFYSHCLQGAPVVRTLCTGGCAKTKTHKEEGGVLGESYVWVFTLLCTLYSYPFLLFLSKVGVDLTTYLDFLEPSFLF